METMCIFMKKRKEKTVRLRSRHEQKRRIIMRRRLIACRSELPGHVRMASFATGGMMSSIYRPFGADLMCSSCRQRNQPAWDRTGSLA
jgi:hypothetical protein